MDSSSFGNGTGSFSPDTDEAGIKRRLQILRQFVRETKRKNRQNQQSKRVDEVGPLFTEFLHLKYDQNSNSSTNLALAYDQDNEEDETKHDSSPQRLIIDVDFELGLKPRTAPQSIAPEATTSASIIKMKDRDGSTNKQLTSFLSPQEEGYYEGILSPLAMAEDKLYLTELQCWVRQNLELFSASSVDIEHSSYGGGRRSSVVLGKIGVRCIHCARAAKAAVDASNPFDRFLWPTAAISYPFNMNGLYTACTQKPHLHFNHCPYLPDNEKLNLKELTQDVPDRPIKRVRGGVPGSLYYVIAAKRVGLLEVEDGMRFGRDLSLDPFPFERVLAQVQDGKQNGTAIAPDELNPKPVESSSAANAAPNQTAPLVGDEASEQVLAEAVAELDDPSKLLALGGDKCLLSDYIFLIVRQMAICNAVPADFASRGKKTKLMRVGFAGFCCRHCSSGDGVIATSDFSCRSFCSAPDNLSSAISNSFSTHLAKCPHVPSRIKKAISAYRRIHQRQMSLLPYGSQRRLFHEMWTRLRAADKTESEMEETLESMKPVSTPVSTDDTVAMAVVEPTAAAASNLEEVPERGAGFPVSNHPETVSLLQRYIETWDPKDNHCLIVPDDKNLVSDYVFLTIRQLKAALPTSSDSARIRRGVPVTSNFPGVCCVHCADQPTAVMPSGRSFPSAPDNFASALNTSLYNHMQACPFIPEDLKRALVDLRKLHSAQCASIKFGSQRRYFNRLFDRLKRIKSLYGEEPRPGRSHADAPIDLEEAGFLQLPNRSAPTLFVCSRCNMVPIQFRAAGSFFSQRPSTASVRDHKLRCAGGKLDLTLVIEAFRTAAASLNKDPHEILSLESFKTVMKHAIDPGGNDLFYALYHGIQSILDNGNSARACITERGDLWMSFSARSNYAKVRDAFKGFAAELRCDSSNLEDHPDMYSFLLMIAPNMGLTEEDRDGAQSSSET